MYLVRWKADSRQKYNSKRQAMKKKAPQFELHWFFKVDRTCFEQFWTNVTFTIIHSIDKNQTKYDKTCENISSNIPPFALRLKNEIPHKEKWMHDACNSKPDNKTYKIPREHKVRYNIK